MFAKNLNKKHGITSRYLPTALLFLMVLFTYGCAGDDVEPYQDRERKRQRSPELRIVRSQSGSVPLGSEATVTWFAHKIKHVTVFYSVNNGADWIELVSRETDSGYFWSSYVYFGRHYHWVEREDSHTFTLPNTITKSVLFRIEGGGLSHEFDNGLRVDGYVTLAAQRDVYYGQPCDFFWSSAGDVGWMRLEYSLDLGKTWVIFADKLSNDGHHRWVLPGSGLRPNTYLRITTSKYGYTYWSAMYPKKVPAGSG